MKPTAPIDDAAIRRALEGCRGDWKAIADDAGVSHSWLSKFVNEHIPNPGYTTLRKVREAIERRKATSPEKEC